ncbi:MAG: sensor histidine kinase, partial [Clostridia bacterium]|nr:sensor histidine kinase [Clostridia bacterium]
MRLLKSFSTKMTAITLVLFLLFCAVSTVSWYYNFTQEATITAEENIGAVIKALSSNFEANLRDIDYVTALVSNKVHTSSNDCLIRYLTAEDDDMAFVSYLQESQKYLSNRCSFKTYLNGLAVYNFDGRMCSYGITTPFHEIESKAWYQEIISGNRTL